MESILSNNCFKNKKVLITGGCGFIGSHLVNRLIDDGANIGIICRRNTSRYKIIDTLRKIEFYNVDITDSIKTEECVKKVMPDYVFHLAAYGVDSAKKEYIPAANVNVIGTINVLSPLKDTGCKKFINVGSCAEYGDIDQRMMEHMCPKPVSIYGSTKAASTIVAHQIAMENNIPIATLRPFGIFGEGEERHKLFCHVILSILENKKVELTLGEQCRDYCYVENIIDGLLLAAENETIKNEIFNIGSGISFPLKHYINLIFMNMGTNQKPNWGSIPYRENEMWDPKPDITKIQSILNWKPRISIEDGMNRTINWFKENKDLYI